MKSNEDKFDIFGHLQQEYAANLKIYFHLFKNISEACKFIVDYNSVRKKILFLKYFFFLIFNIFKDKK